MDTCFRLERAKVKLIDYCNLHCEKCNHWRWSRSAKRDRLDPLTLDEWLHFGEQAVALGISQVRFSGGEPTLSPYLTGLCKFYAKAGVHCAITTNGTLIDQELAEQLIEAGLKQYTFSVDGPDAISHDRSVGTPGAYRCLEAAIQHLTSSSEVESVSVNCVIGHHNRDRLPEMIDWASAHAIREVDLIRLQTRHLGQHDTSSTSGVLDVPLGEFACLRHYGELRGVQVTHTGFVSDREGDLVPVDIQWLEQAPCAVARNRITVYPSGDVFVCCHAKNKLLRYGNIRETRLAELLYNDTAREIRDRCKKPSLIPECIDCDLRMQDRYTFWRYAS